MSRVSKAFTTEQVVDPQYRGYGVVHGPSGRVAWERKKGALDKQADVLIGRKRRAKKGSNNRTGVINKKTQAALGHVAWLFGAGYPIRKIARMTKLALNTVTFHIARMGLQAGYCGCGAKGTHRGWCSYRYALSPARQAFIRKWIEEQGSKRAASRGE
jgi:hypothetical protein